MGNAMTNSIEDRRNRQTPIPGDLKSLLSDEQQASIDELIEMGWKLWFVRRPKFQPVIPVLTDTKNAEIVMIDEDGSILEESIVKLRDQ